MQKNTYKYILSITDHTWAVPTFVTLYFPTCSKVSCFYVMCPPDHCNPPLKHCTSPLPQPAASHSSAQRGGGTAGRRRNVNISVYRKIPSGGENE